MILSVPPLLTQMNQILSHIARPTGCTTMSNEMFSDTPSETHVPLEEFSVTEIKYNPTSNDASGSGESQVLQTPRLSQASIQAERVAPNKSTVTAGASQSGRVHTMSQRILCRPNIRSAEFYFIYSYVNMYLTRI